MTPILVTGATGNIGREVVAQLSAAGCHVRAMSRTPEEAGLPAPVEVVRGDLSAPDTLDACLRDVDALFLVWQLPFAPAAVAMQRIAWGAKSVVLLTSPHRTPHPFYQQPNALRGVHAGLEQLIEQSGLRWTFLRPGPLAVTEVRGALASGGAAVPERDDADVDYRDAADRLRRGRQSSRARHPYRRRRHRASRHVRSGTGPPTTPPRS